MHWVHSHKYWEAFLAQGHLHLRIKESVIDFICSAVDDYNVWNFKASLSFYIIISTRVSVINYKLPLPLYKILFQTADRIYIFLIYIYLYNFSLSHHRLSIFFYFWHQTICKLLLFSYNFTRIVLIRLCLMQVLNSLSHSPWYFLQNIKNFLTNWGQPA